MRSSLIGNSGNNSPRMKQKLLTYTIFLLIFLASCNPQPDIKGFDQKKWQDDKFGCSGNRSTEVALLLKNKKQLQGKSERTIIKLLGKPDQIAFFKRNIRNLIYYTEPGNQCEGNNNNSAGKRVIVELNALGNVTWINEEII